MSQCYPVPGSPMTAVALPWTSAVTAKPAAGSPGSPRSAVSHGSQSTLGRPQSPEELSIYEHGKERRRNYRYLRTIGNGTEGVVKEGLCLTTGNRVALKIVRKSAADQTGFGSRQRSASRLDEMEARVREMRRKFHALGDLSHDNLLRFIEFFETDEKMYLVTELCEMDLQTFLDSRRGSLSETHIRVILRGGLDGVQFLHSQGIVHRDLKPQNILLRSSQNLTSVCISDFSGAHIPEVPGTGDLMMKTVIGTPFYVAPCVILGEGYSSKVDIWSLGCVAFQLCFDKTPFQHSTSFIELYSNICEGRWSFPDETTGSNIFRDLVTKLLAGSPEDRPSASEALAHPFFASDRPSSHRASGAFVVFSSDTGELNWDPLNELDDSGCELTDAKELHLYPPQERLRMLLH